MLHPHPHTSAWCRAVTWGAAATATDEITPTEVACRCQEQCRWSQSCDRLWAPPPDSTGVPSPCSCLFTGWSGSGAPVASVHPPTFVFRLAASRLPARAAGAQRGLWSSWPSARSLLPTSGASANARAPPLSRQRSPDRDPRLLATAHLSRVRKPTAAQRSWFCLDPGAPTGRQPLRAAPSRGHRAPVPRRAPGQWGRDRGTHPSRHTDSTTLVSEWFRSTRTSDIFNPIRSLCDQSRCHK